MTNEHEEVTIEKLTLLTNRMALLVGTILGQISNLLNTCNEMDNEKFYKCLLDIHKAAALQVHELFYKGNQP